MKIVRYLLVFLLASVFQVNANFEPILYKTYRGRLVLLLTMNDVYNAQSEAQLEHLFAFMRKYNLKKDFEGRVLSTPFRVKIIVHTGDSLADSFQQKFILKHAYHSRLLFRTIKNHKSDFVVDVSQLPKVEDEIDHIFIAMSSYGPKLPHFESRLDIFFDLFCDPIGGCFKSSDSDVVDYLKAELESTHTIFITNFPSAQLFFEAKLLGEKPASVSNLELLRDNSHEQKRFIAYTYNGKKLPIDEINLCELSFDQRALVGLARKMLNPIAAHSECRAHSWKPHVTSKGRFSPLGLSEKELNNKTLRK